MQKSNRMLHKSHKYIERLIPSLVKWKDKKGQMLIVMFTWVSRTSAIIWETKIICDRVYNVL